MDNDFRPRNRDALRGMAPRRPSIDGSAPRRHAQRPAQHPNQHPAQQVGQPPAPINNQPQAQQPPQHQVHHKPQAQHVKHPQQPHNPQHHQSQPQHHQPQQQYPQPAQPQHHPVQNRPQHAQQPQQQYPQPRPLQHNAQPQQQQLKPIHQPQPHRQPQAFPQHQSQDLTASLPSRSEMSLDNPAVHAEGGRDFSPANAKTKAKLPKGIYIIGGLVVADLIIAIIGLTHVASALYIFTMVIELLVVASLFSQVKIARKAALISQGLVIVMIGFVIVSLAQTQIQTSQLSTKYDKTVVDAGAVATQQQETTIDNLTTQINSNHIQVGKLAGVAYARDVLAIFVSLGVIWYLARPGVKTAFR